MSLRSIDAVILCGGLETRLREETEFRPKPMVEIGGKPILWRIMRRYHKYGVRRFILCLGYKGEAIRDYFLNYRFRNADLCIKLKSRNVTILSDGVTEDWEVVLAETGDATVTGARIKRALRHVKSENFFVAHGDGVADIDSGKLWEAHVKAGRHSTVTAVHRSSRYGEIDVEHDAVLHFAEKLQVHDGWINGSTRSPCR